MSSTSGDKRKEPGKAIAIIPAKDLPKLTARQQMFCEEYLRNGFNGTKAILSVGYTGKHPHVQANALLKNETVSKYLKLRKTQMVKDAGLDTHRMLLELCSIAFVDVRGLYDKEGAIKNVRKIPKRLSAAIESIESEEITHPVTGAIIGYTKKVKMQNKLKAIELLMRFKGLLTPKEKDNTINLNNINLTLDLGNGNVIKLNNE